MLSYGGQILLFQSSLAAVYSDILTVSPQTDSFGKARSVLIQIEKREEAQKIKLIYNFFIKR